jgi:hypothetical protein
MDSYHDFKEKLDFEHQWPTVYMFKFVVPSEKVQEFHGIFEEESLQSKKSKSGKYASFTLKKMMSSSQEVVEIYLKARKIEGIIAL